MTTNNAVLNLNPICILPLAFTVIFDLGGTVTGRCQFNEAVNSVRTLFLSASAQVPAQLCEELQRWWFHKNIL